LKIAIDGNVASIVPYHHLQTVVYNKEKTSNSKYNKVSIKLLALQYVITKTNPKQPSCKIVCKPQEAMVKKM